MKSRTIPPFWKLYNRLPPDIQRRADRAYQLWQVNPFAKGLYFKRVEPNEPIYSVLCGNLCPRYHKLLACLGHKTAN